MTDETDAVDTRRRVQLFNLFHQQLLVMVVMNLAAGELYLFNPSNTTYVQRISIQYLIHLKRMM